MPYNKNIMYCKYYVLQSMFRENVNPIFDKMNFINNKNGSTWEGGHIKIDLIRAKEECKKILKTNA